jgi:hypothetical protein
MPETKTEKPIDDDELFAFVYGRADAATRKRIKNQANRDGELVVRIRLLSELAGTRSGLEPASFWSHSIVLLAAVSGMVLFVIGVSFWFARPLPGATFTVGYRQQLGSPAAASGPAITKDGVVELEEDAFELRIAVPGNGYLTVVQISGRGARSFPKSPAGVKIEDLEKAPGDGSAIYGPFVVSDSKEAVFIFVTNENVSSLVLKAVDSFDLLESDIDELERSLKKALRNEGATIVTWDRLIVVR